MKLAQSLNLEETSGQYVKISDATQTNLELTTPTSFKINAWLNPESLPTSGSTYFGLCGKYDSASGQRGWTFDLRDDNKLSFLYSQTAGGSPYAWKYSTAAAIVSADIGTWVKYTAEVTPATETIVLSKNDTSLALTTLLSGGTSIADTTADFTIGKANGSATTDGLIGKVEIWDTSTGSDVLIDSWEFQGDATSTSGDNDLTAINSPDYQYSSPDSFIQQIETVEHDTTNGTQNAILKWDDTHFIDAYQGNAADGWVSMFSIDTDGTNITEIDSKEFDTNFASEISITKVDSTHFAIGYAGNGNDGWIKIYSVDGSFNLTFVSQREHDTSNGRYNSIEAIGETHLILSYAGNTISRIRTFSLDGSYAITQIDSEDFSDATTYNKLVKMTDTLWVNIYKDDESDGRARVVTLDGSFNITLGNDYEFEANNPSGFDAVKVGTDEIAVFYRDGSTVNQMKVLQLDGSNILSTLSTTPITLSSTSTANSLQFQDDLLYLKTTYSLMVYEFDGSFVPTLVDAKEPQVFMSNVSMVLTDTNAVVAHSGSGNDGYITTYKVAEGATPPADESNAIFFACNF